MKPTVILSSSDYSDSYKDDEIIPVNLKKELNTTDSESDEDDFREKVVIKTFNPGKTAKKQTIPANKFFRRTNINKKIFDLCLDESSSEESYDDSYYYCEEEDSSHEIPTRTKITKQKVPLQNEKFGEEIDLNNDNAKSEKKKINNENKTEIRRNRILQANRRNIIIKNRPKLAKKIIRNSINEIGEEKISNENEEEQNNNENKEEQINNGNKEKENKNENEEDQNNNEDKEEQIDNENKEKESKNEDKEEQSSNGDKESENVHEEDSLIQEKGNETNSSQRNPENETSADMSELATVAENKEAAQAQESSQIGDEEEDIDPPIVKINNFQTKPSITYSIVRTLESTLLTKHYSYSFYLESLQKNYAKAKARSTELVIPLFEGPTVNFKKSPKYTLLIDKELKAFSLKEGDKSGNEMMTLKVCMDSLLILPTHVDVQVLSSDKNSQISLTTKNPKMSTRGHWVLDFNGKFTIPSERNMIFVSAKEKEGADLILIRQISNDEIDIDLCTDLDEIYVFAIGLSIFIAKLS